MVLSLYCRLPFGQFHPRDPEIIRAAESIGRSPSALAIKIATFAGLDDATFPTGHKRLTAATSLERALWNEMQSDWDHFAEESQQAVSDLLITVDGAPGLDDHKTEAGGEQAIEDTVQVHQAFFCTAVSSAYGWECCITGLAMPALLVASHIVPRRTDRHNWINPRNGLLLSVLHAQAFSAGLITLNEDMTVWLSPTLYAKDNEFLTVSMEAYEGQRISLPQKFAPDPDFLAFHREDIFQR